MHYDHVSLFPRCCKEQLLRRGDAEGYFFDHLAALHLEAVLGRVMHFRHMEQFIKKIGYGFPENHSGASSCNET